MAKFLETIEPIDEGRLIMRLDEALTDVTEAVANTTQDGSVTLKLVVKWENGMARIAPKIDAKIPRHGVASAGFYFGDKGSGDLFREDPRQTTMKNILDPKKSVPLRTVPKPGDDSESNQ